MLIDNSVVKTGGGVGIGVRQRGVGEVGTPVIMSTMKIYIQEEEDYVGKG